MSTNGILDFQNTNKVIFRGTDSNVVVDTSNASIGIGIQGTEKPGSNLHVIGDASISSNLKLTTDTSITVNSNVVTDFNGPHAREPKELPLKKYPEMIFEDEKVDRNDTTNTYTQAGYTISTDSVYGDRQVYKAFSTKGGQGSTTAHVWSSEDVGGNGYVLATGDPISGVTFQDENGTSYTGHYIKLELPKKIKLNSISFKSQKNTYNSTNNDKRPTSGTFLGSNDGTNWVLLKTFNEGELSWSGGLVPGATTDYVYSTTLNNIVSDGYFSYILFVIETIGNNNEYGPTEVRDLKYYGYEEDPPAGDHSVDTTFKPLDIMMLVMIMRIQGQTLHTG